MSNFHDGWELPSGLTEVTNTSSEPDRIYTRDETQQAWDNIKTGIALILRSMAKAWDKIRQHGPSMDRIAQLQAIGQGNRYWRDHLGQPRRNPNMKPLLHNGRKPR